MILSVTRCEVKPFKMNEAVDMFKRAQSYDKKQPEVEDSIVMRPLQGKLSWVMTSVRFPSLAALEEHRKKEEKDPEIQAFMKDSQECFVLNTFERNQYEVVEQG